MEGGRHLLKVADALMKTLKTGSRDRVTVTHQTLENRFSDRNVSNFVLLITMILKITVFHHHI